MLSGQIKSRDVLFEKYYSLSQSIACTYCRNIRECIDNVNDIKSSAAEGLLNAIDSYLAACNDVNDIKGYIRKAINNSCIKAKMKVMYYYPFAGQGSGSRRSMFGFCNKRPESVSFVEECAYVSENLDILSVRHEGYNNILRKESIKKAKQILGEVLAGRTERRYNVFLALYYTDGASWEGVSKKFNIGTSTMARDIKKVREEIFERYPELNEFL